MGSLWERLILGDGECAAAIGGPANRPGNSESTRGRRISDSTALGPADYLAVLAFAGLGGPESEGPPLVQQAPPRPRLEACLGESSLARLLPATSRPARLALAAGLLQIHDFWEPSHEAAQAADDLGENKFSAYWHGIGHRREPDAGNAAYWFRRVGRHPVFVPLADEAKAIFEESGNQSWQSRLLGQGSWNAMAMIDLCTAAKPGTAEETLARRLQRLEMQLLLDATAEADATQACRRSRRTP